MMSRQSAALTIANEYTMPPELGGKWVTECLNTWFPLPTLLFDSVKLILFFLKLCSAITPTSPYLPIGMSLWAEGSRLSLALCLHLLSCRVSS